MRSSNVSQHGGASPTTSRHPLCGRRFRSSARSPEPALGSNYAHAMKSTTWYLIAAAAVTILAAAVEHSPLVFVAAGLTVAATAIALVAQKLAP